MNRDELDDWFRVTQTLADGFAAMAAVLADAIASGLEGKLPDDPRDRALWLRQHRNAGPIDVRGLDGWRR